MKIANCQFPNANLPWRYVITLVAISAIDPLIVKAQGADSSATRESAPKLVREANELLLGDKPAEALRSYEKAQALRPDAREIAFDQALAHYRMGDFDKAREAFTRAAEGVGDALADDAMYGLGTCDHAEALGAQDPKEAVSKIENAMRNYQSVLGNQRDHGTARDANLKAASYWRQLKQQMQQQEQQQNQDQQNKEDQEQQEKNQQREQQSEQQQQEQQEQQSEQNKQDQKKEQEQKASAQKEQREQKEQSAEQKEEASRDQAERKLREMVQAMRDRKKHRREETKTPTYRPTEKDW